MTIKGGVFSARPISPRSKGVVPAAVLGSIDFDETQVDFSTVTFGVDGTSPAHDGHVEGLMTTAQWI